MSAHASRILFCDYDGEFQFSEELSRVGYAIDQIRPDALRQVGVGDHQLFLFSFESKDSLSKVLKTCEKLKFAELSTPIALLARQPMGPDFLNHQKAKYAADAYISNPATEAGILDILDPLIGCPIPPHLKSARLYSSDDPEDQRALESLKQQIAKLEEELQQAKGMSQEAREKEEALKPKLKALLEGQKLQFQTESERLRVQLSEVEAKLLDREAKIKELEATQERVKKQFSDIVSQHEKAQQTLRDFYMNKLKTLENEKRELEKKTSS